MIRQLEEKFLELYCQIFFDKFVGKNVLEFDGFSREVFIFDADNIMGFSMPWGRIMVNRKLLEADNSTALRHIFLHEIGHTESNKIIMVVSGLFQFLLYPMPLALGTTGMVFTGFAAFSEIFSGILEPGLAASTFGFLVVLYPAASIISYLGEFRAEFFAIQHTGREKYQEAHRQHMEIRSERSLLTKAVIRTSHPSPEITLKIHDFLN
jgi:Zn-dependent protease with chaperone function